MLYLYHISFYSKPRGGALLQSWYCTNYETAIANSNYPGLTFQPQAGIKHSDITYDGEKSAGQITLTVPRDFEVAQKFLAGYPAGSLFMRVYEVDGPEPSAMAQSIWQGKIRSCAFSELTAALTGTDGREALTRLGLRLNGGTGCQWDLYGPDCGLNEATYTRSGTVTAISADGLTVTTTLSEADGFFKSGKLKFGNSARMVTANVGGLLTLFTAMPGLAVGVPIAATRGCQRNPTSCKALGNYARYSGFAEFSTPKNIYTGIL